MAEASQRTSTDGDLPPGGDKWPAGLRMTMFVVMAGEVMPLLDSAIMHVALRPLAAGLRMPLPTAQWTVTAYLLAFAAAVPTSTWVMQRFGPERAYLPALGLFTLASVLCGASNAPWQLIAARAVQGAAGGVLGSVSRMMLVTASGPRRLPRVMAAFGVPVMLVSVAGSLVAGELLTYGGWRSIFFINVPIGLLAMTVARRLERPRPSGPKRALDVVGLVLISPGLVGLTYGVSNAGHGGGVDSPMVAVPTCTGVALIVAFVVWSVRDRRPLLDVRLYRHVVFRAAAQSALVTGAAVIGGTILLPLYLQTVRGENLSRTGLLIAPQGVGVAAATWLSGRLFERIGTLTVLAGTSILLTATVPFAFLTPTTSYRWLVTLTLIRGIGIGLAMTPAMTAAYQTLSPSQASEASTQFNALHHIGGSLGTAILVMVLARIPHALGHDPIPQTHTFDVAYRVLSTMAGLSVLPALMLVHGWRRRVQESFLRDGTQLLPR
ncbi:DHA2 family efflux MFS transporter permease subunit [Streptomyces sp. RB6PN25]|uniref:DHA2 family efflux MFS transporter permease subunit n=1 Tax=Streptomyces humicola TaxID=2953240 RepID=A0ABT1PRG3_9ACTN|nr:DHA2 family efflux MFS transporter permease subunit [Streptomyces humicola]MCQ4079160.1 DHA2 family efflux MFS transporter permease subunit [Streptomyces humicola]